MLSVFMATAVNAYAAFTPEAGEKYYIIQDTGGAQLVLGGPANEQPKVVNAENDATQLFEFIPTGTADIYYIKNDAGVYLSKNASSGWNTQYESEPNGNNSEWIISGDNFNDIRLQVVAKNYLAADGAANGSNLYCDKTISNANGKFKLVKASEVYQNGIIDGGFENATKSSAPMGVWINDLGKAMGDSFINGASLTRIMTGSNVASGSNCLYITFRQYDKNGYNAISTALKGLTKGATYSFSFKYRQDGVDDHFADVYAATTANAAKDGAIGDVYTTSLDAKTAVQTGTISFTAMSETYYIVFRNQQGGVSTEFNFYIDDLSVVKTAEPVASINVSKTALSFDQTNRTNTFSVTGIDLSDSISISAPKGIVVSSSKISTETTPITVYFTSFESLTGDITLKSGSITKTIPFAANVGQPSLVKKSMVNGTSGVTSALSTAKNINADNDVRDMTTVEMSESFPQEYTIEVKAKINSSEGRGLDIELRDENKAGFRIAVNDEKMYDFTLCNLPTYFPSEKTGNDYRTYRYVVEGTQVHIYIDKKYYSTTNITTDVKPNNLIDNGGFELKGLTGWTNPTGWGRDQVNDFAYSGTSSLDLHPWHGSNTLVAQYTLPVEKGDYFINFQYTKRSGSQQYRWGLATVANADINSSNNFITGPWNGLANTSWTSQSHEFTLSENTSDLSLYFVEWSSGGGIAVDDLELTKKEEATITPYFAFGKAFGKGSANIDVEYVNYNLSGAYAPDNTSTSIEESETNATTAIAYSEGNIYVQNAGSETLNIYSLSGELVFSKTVSGSEVVSINIEKGFYIAQLGSQTIKFIK